MDSLDLLARENEFKKLNKQLEKKTESLMKEIEHVMQKQDFFTEFSHNISLSPDVTPKKHRCGPKLTAPEQTPTKSRNIKTGIKTSRTEQKPSTTGSNEPVNNFGNTRNAHEDCSSCVNNVTRKCNVCDYCAMSRKDRVEGDLEFLYAFVSVNVQEKVLPPSFLKDRATVESVCKFLSSKIMLMQVQIEKLQDTINKKASQCEAHLTHQSELESERMSLLNKSNCIKASSADMKAKYMAIQKRLEEKERLYKEQRSETDKLSSEVKRLRSKNASAEARCASQEEVIEGLRHQLSNAKRSEKEFRDSTRSLSTSHEAAITKLESRIKVLTTRIDRQAALIDNLRQQNALLSTDGALKALEKEYCNFLQDF